jgi:hypothetical protein
VSEDPTQTAARPAKKSATNKTAAKKAPAKKATTTTKAAKAPAKATATKAPAGTSAAKKSAPGDKLPTRKKAAQSAKAATPKAAEPEADKGGDVRTPSGIPAAGEGTNPSTTEPSLEQPGTEPLVDPATAKQVASESRTMQQAAETHPGTDNE